MGCAERRGWNWRCKLKLWSQAKVVIVQRSHLRYRNRLGNHDRLPRQSKIPRYGITVEFWRSRLPPLPIRAMERVKKVLQTTSRPTFDYIPAPNYNPLLQNSSVPAVMRVLWMMIVIWVVVAI